MKKPRSIGAIRKDPEVARDLAEGGVLAAVPLVMETGRPVKANLSLQVGLLAAIDEAAAARGLTRSAFLASAAREKIAAEGYPGSASAATAAAATAALYRGTGGA